MGNFEQVTIKYRDGEIVIQEVPASFAGEVFEKLDEMRESGVKERIVNETFVALWCAESVVSETGQEPLSSEEKERIRDLRPKRWFDAVWPEVDKLNLLTKPEKDEAEKNSDEVEPISSTSTDSAEISDIQV